MSYLRIGIDLAFPMPLNTTVKARLKALREEIRQAKKYAKKINEGSVNEEETNRGVYHICHHDTNEPCEPEVEI